MKPRTALSTAALLLAISTAEAHDLIPGVTGLPGAALHMLTASDQVMALVAAGLLAGARGWRGVIAGLAGLAAGFVAGFANLLYGPDVPLAWLAALVIALVVAIATALNLRPHPAAAFLAAAAIAFFVGNGALPEGESWADIAATGAGTFAGVAVIAGVPAIVSALLKRGWPRVLVRMAASWIAASALMVLAFALAPLLRG